MGNPLLEYSPRLKNQLCNQLRRLIKITNKDPHELGPKDIGYLNEGDKYKALFFERLDNIIDLEKNQPKYKIIYTYSLYDLDGVTRITKTATKYFNNWDYEDLKRRVESHRSVSNHDSFEIKLI